MKKIFAMMLATLLGLQGFSQQHVSQGSDPGQVKRFFAGINYTNLSVNMELSALKLHSVWYGSDLGTEVKTDDQIDEINGFADRYTRINALTVQVGMVFLDKPDVKWKLKGSIFGGMADNLTTVTNTQNDVKEYTFNSGFSRPLLGLEFDLGYQFSSVWGVVLRPVVTGSMGKSSTITDLVNPDMLNFTASKENKYRTLYGKVNLLASFTKGRISVFAGPGFYRIWSHHEYKREYTQTEDWETITEEMTTDIVSKNFIDGNIGASWIISDHFSVNALVGISSDIYVNAGLHFNF
jgi:opacity protein-like surface antigen